MMHVLSQEVVSHDRMELYAVIGALVAVIVYKERQNVRLVSILSKLTKDDEEPK